MVLKEFVRGKIRTGIDVEFFSAQGNSGKVLMVVSDDKRYILQDSIKNFQRFRKWEGEKASADIRKTGKFFKTEYGFLPTIDIRTTVKVDDDRIRDKYINDDDWSF